MVKFSPSRNQVCKLSRYRVTGPDQRLSVHHSQVQLSSVTHSPSYKAAMACAGMCTQAAARIEAALFRAGYEPLLLQATMLLIRGGHTQEVFVSFITVYCKPALSSKRKSALAAQVQEQGVSSVSKKKIHLSSSNAATACRSAI